jgi:hypothetical protein
LVDQVDLQNAFTVGGAGDLFTAAFTTSLAHPPNDADALHAAVMRSFDLFHTNSKVVAPNAAPLLPLVKFRPGNGGALPAHAAPGNVGYGAAALPVVAVGAAPALMGAGGDFPSTVAELRSLSHAEVNRLVFIYNVDLMIVTGDDLTARRQQLELWVSGLL